MVRSLRFLALGALLASLPACGLIGTPLPLGDALDGDLELTQLTERLEQENLIAELESLPALTLFAPVDGSFEAVSAAQLLTLEDTLRYHVANQLVRSADLEDGMVLETLFGNSALGVAVGAAATLTDGSGATVEFVRTDIEIANGVIHKIEMVLTPPPPLAEVADTQELSTLLDALEATGLSGSFDGSDDGPVSLFAPTDAAFEAFLADQGVANIEALIVLRGVGFLERVLLYHAVDDRDADGDARLVGAYEAVTAAERGRLLPTLIAAVNCAPNEKEPLELMLDGNALMISNPEGVDDATVGATNLLASNGVMHVIDQVLQPPPLPDPPCA